MEFSRTLFLTSLGNAFKDTSSQQVKRMLSSDCILVRTRANSVVSKGTKMAKNSYNVYFLPLVRTKASEPSDIPGVNTPLNVFVNFLKLECFD